MKMISLGAMGCANQLSGGQNGGATRMGIGSSQRHLVGMVVNICVTSAYDARATLNGDDGLQFGS